MSESISMIQESILRKPIEDRYVGIRVLWVRVIQRALYDFVSYRDSDNLQKRKDAQSAEEWIFGKNALFNSLDCICYYLNISPEMVRDRAKSMTKAEAVKMEHLERTSDGQVRGLLHGIPLEDEDG